MHPCNVNRAPVLMAVRSIFMSFIHTFSSSYHTETYETPLALSAYDKPFSIPIDSTRSLASDVTVTDPHLNPLSPLINRIFSYVSWQQLFLRGIYFDKSNLDLECSSQVMSFYSAKMNSTRFRHFSLAGALKKCLTYMIYNLLIKFSFVSFETSTSNFKCKVLTNLHKRRKNV